MPRANLQRIVAAASVLLSVISAPAIGQNLIQNGEFDTDLSQWTIATRPGGSVSWLPDDYATSPESGSALLVNAIPCVPIDGAFNCFSPMMTQCVAIQAGTLYRFGMAARGSTGQTSTGIATMFLEWHADPTCAGPSLHFLTVGIRSTTSWQVSSNGASPPAGARSGLVRVSAFRDDVPTGDYRVLVDHVFVEPAAVGRGAGPEPGRAKCAGCHVRDGRLVSDRKESHRIGDRRRASALR